MTAGDVIHCVDGQKHNVYSQAEKLAWLDTIEKWAVELHQRCGVPHETGEMTMGTELSIPAPYDRIYMYWLGSQIDYANQEYLKCNNGMTMSMAMWKEYANSLRRKAANVGRRKFF